MEKKFCVYIHRRVDGIVFYVGIGLIKRPYSKRRRSQFWHNVVNKYGPPIVEVLHKNLTWKDAAEREWMYIQYYGRRDKGRGTLVNQTEGGDGHPSEAWNKNIPRTDEEKLNISLGTKKAMDGIILPKFDHKKAWEKRIEKYGRKGRKPSSEKTKYTVKTCPHCGKVGAGRKMNQYHFDNCKHKNMKEEIKNLFELEKFRYDSDGSVPEQWVSCNYYFPVDVIGKLHLHYCIKFLKPEPIEFNFEEVTLQKLSKCYFLLTDKNRHDVRYEYVGECKTIEDAIARLKIMIEEFHNLGKQQPKL